MVYFHWAECIPSRPGSISGRQNVFRHVPCQFLVGKVCSAASWVDFQMAECILPRPGPFLVGRVCSAMSRVDFRSSQCVLPCPRSISGRQSVFRVNFQSAECVPPRPGQFPVGRVSSAMSRVDFQSAEYFWSIRISSD